MPEREVVAVVNRPQDIEDDAAMALARIDAADADESQTGRVDICKTAPERGRGRFYISV